MKVLLIGTLHFRPERNVIYNGLRKILKKNLTIYPAIAETENKITIDTLRTEELERKIRKNPNQFEKILFLSFQEEHIEMYDFLLKNYYEKISFLDIDDVPFYRGFMYNKKITYYKRERLISSARSYAYLFRYYKTIPYYLLRSIFLLCKNPNCWKAALSQAYMWPAIGNNEQSRLPIGISKTTAPKCKKKYDVCFIGRIDNKQRRKIAKCLKKIASQKILVYVSQKEHTFKEYQSILASSKIGIDVRGWGFDTFRKYEIPYYGGALIAEKPLLTNEKFKENESCAYYAKPKQLIQLILTLLKNDRWKEMARQGKKVVLDNYSDEKIAKEILQ